MNGPRPPRPTVAAALIAAAAGLLVAGCSGGRASDVATADLGLPLAASPAPLATASVDTSPDGGIYRNPDALAVVAVARVEVRAVRDRLGGDAAAWADLDGLGRFVAVAITVTNNGKAGSEPAMNDLQVASDYAPDGTAEGPLRHYYHPTYPLATLSPLPLVGGCTVHLDPGQRATLVLLYPPLREAPSVLWGRYQVFALTLPFGGAVAGVGDQLHAAPCRPPSPSS